MTPKQRVEAVLKGQPVDKVPFTCYDFLIYTGTVERELRNQGLCYIMMYRSTQVFKFDTPNVSKSTTVYNGEDGILREEISLETPSGILTQVGKVLPCHPRIPKENRPFPEEYLFKGPQDYDAIMTMIADRIYSDNYQAFSTAQQEVGDDGLFLPDIGFSPMSEMLLEIMGLLNFSKEYHSRSKQFFELYELLLEDRRKRIRIAADYPDACFVGCDGNVTPNIVGLERFEKYYIPYYNEFADILHKKDKILSVHFDDNTKLFAEAIAKSKIGCVEAFDANNDMSIAEARKHWPDKILWTNFPSADHLKSAEQVAERPRQILKEAAPLDKFLMGITENIPHDRWRETLPAIAKVIDDEGCFK